MLFDLINTIINKSVKEALSNKTIVERDIATTIIYNVAVIIKYPAHTSCRKIMQEDGSFYSEKYYCPSEELGFIIPFKVAWESRKEYNNDKIIDIIKKSYTNNDIYKRIIENHRNRNDFIVDFYIKSTNIESEKGYKLI